MYYELVIYLVSRENFINCIIYSFPLSGGGVEVWSSFFLYFVLVHFKAFIKCTSCYIPSQAII